MCTVCGCNAFNNGPTLASTGADEGAPQRRHDHHRNDHVHDREWHDHPHGHDHVHKRTPVQGAGGSGAERLVRVEQDILADNDRLAARNRAFFLERGILGLNLMSGPGAGKTTLLVRTIEDLGGAIPITVIEGDQETSFDAERVRSAGVRAVQINTGKGCHLDARMVGDALPSLAPNQRSVVFIENVGNLVCPAAFDLGEAARVVLLSVTEGDDKPLKYANMFAAAQLMLVTKIDLLPFVPFDLQRCSAFARRLNPEIEIMPVSATSGDGMDRWYGWIARRQADLGTSRLIEIGAVGE